MASASAIAAPAAVIVVGGLAICGAWERGEWTPEQAWNPLTHVKNSTANPPNVIPFPGPKRTPAPPPPPPGGTGRDGACFSAYMACVLADPNNDEHWESCRQAYLNCKNGLPTIFPGGGWVQ